MSVVTCPWLRACQASDADPLTLSCVQYAAVLVARSFDQGLHSLRITSEELRGVAKTRTLTLTLTLRLREP